MNAVATLLNLLAQRECEWIEFKHNHARHRTDGRDVQ